MPFSKKQQIAARIALHAPKSKLKGASLQMRESMTDKELKDFASGPISKRKPMSAR